MIEKTEKNILSKRQNIWCWMHFPFLEANTHGLLWERISWALDRYLWKWGKAFRSLIPGELMERIRMSFWTIRGNLNHVFTLAHEMGHALHSWCIPIMPRIIWMPDIAIFVAEVASTCNEAPADPWSDGKTEDKKEKAYLIKFISWSSFAQLCIVRPCLHILSRKCIRKWNRAKHWQRMLAVRMLDCALNQKYYGEAMVSGWSDPLWVGKGFHIFTHRFMFINMRPDFQRPFAISTKILQRKKGLLRNIKPFKRWLFYGSDRPAGNSVKLLIWKKNR